MIANDGKRSPLSMSLGFLTVSSRYSRKSDRATPNASARASARNTPCIRRGPTGPLGTAAYKGVIDNNRISKVVGIAQVAEVALAHEGVEGERRYRCTAGLVVNTDRGIDGLNVVSWTDVAIGIWWMSIAPGGKVESIEVSDRARCGSGWANGSHTRADCRGDSLAACGCFQRAQDSLGLFALGSFFLDWFSIWKITKMARMDLLPEPEEETYLTRT